MSEFKAGDPVTVDGVFHLDTTNTEFSYVIIEDSARLVPTKSIHPASPFEHGQEVEASRVEGFSSRHLRRYAGFINGEHFCYDTTVKGMLHHWEHVRAIPKKQAVMLDEKAITIAKNGSRPGAIMMCEDILHLCKAIAEGAKDE